jgi:hypothetical protein
MGRDQLVQLGVRWEENSVMYVYCRNGVSCYVLVSCGENSNQQRNPAKMLTKRHFS